MKIIYFLATIILTVSTATATDITFQWSHTGVGPPRGFTLFMGDSPNSNSMSEVENIPNGAARDTVYNFDHSTTKCFGIQAYNSLGLSNVVTSRDDGSPMCLGKPSDPVTFSFSGV